MVFEQVDGRLFSLRGKPGYMLASEDMRECSEFTLVARRLEIIMMIFLILRIIGGMR